MNKTFLYISTHVGMDGSGIYCAELDYSSGATSPFRKVAELERAGAMTHLRHKRHLYSVGVEGAVDANKGCIAAYAVDADTGALHRLNQPSTGAGLPTFITASADEHFMFQVSFSTAAASVLRINEEGALMRSGEIHRFEGKGINPIRQQRSYPHCIAIHPKDNTVFVSDLGTDLITRFRLDDEQGEIVRDGYVQSPIDLGAGPRLMRFSENGNALYVVNELNNSISVYTYDQLSRTLNPVQVISTLPNNMVEGFERQMASDIRIHPNQQYLYVTNRSTGEGQIDGVAVFSRDIVSGRLSFIQHCSTGKHPRYCNIDPSGQWLFVSARDSNQIHRFRINQDSGKLQEVGDPIDFTQPWDLQFYIV